MSNILHFNCEKSSRFSNEDLKAFEMSYNLPDGTMGKFLRCIDNQNAYRQRIYLSFCRSIKMKVAGLVSALVCVIYFLVRYPVI